MSSFVHKSSYVDENVQLGVNTKVWHFCHIISGSKVGDNSSFGQNCVVGPNAIIGNNVKVQNNVSIYDNVRLEDAVFCGPSVVFTNVYNPRSLIDKKDEFLDTIVKKGATLGANSTILCGVAIGKFAFIGADSLILKDVPEFALMVGSPARQIGWVGEFGEKLDLPLNGYKEAVCKKSDQKYRLTGSVLTKISK